MSRPYEIAVTETQKTMSWVVREDEFKYRPDKGFKRLQKLCFWFLRKIGAYVEIEDIAYTRHIIDPVRIAENIHKQYEEIISTYHHKGRRVLIGPEEYHDLTGNPETYKLLNFSAEYGYNHEIFGMKIKVIPWMKGILVVPKDV